MTRRAFAASVLVALCVTGSAFAQLGSAVSAQAARDAADSVAKRFESAYNGGNPAGIADLSIKDGSI